MLCELCHKDHDGSYASGRFCSPECSAKSRQKNRRKTVALKKRTGCYKKNFNPRVSQLQINVSHLLSRAGIKHQVQFQVGRYYFDIKIGNVLLQVNGDYWHANPSKYNAGSIISYPGHKKKLAINVWKKDLKKKLQAAKRGFRVIYVWQDQVHKNPQAVLLQKIIHRIRNQNEAII